MPAYGTRYIIPQFSDLSSTIYLIPKYLLIIAYIAEALAENILCIGYDKERIFIDVFDDLSDIGNLSALHNTQQHLLILMGIRALALEDRNAAVQPVGYVFNELIAFFADYLADI